MLEFVYVQSGRVCSDMLFHTDCIIYIVLITVAYINTKFYNNIMENPFKRRPQTDSDPSEEYLPKPHSAARTIELALITNDTAWVHIFPEEHRWGEDRVGASTTIDRFVADIDDVLHGFLVTGTDGIEYEVEIVHGSQKATISRIGYVREGVFIQVNRRCCIEPGRKIAKLPEKPQVSHTKRLGQWFVSHYPA